MQRDRGADPQLVRELHDVLVIFPVIRERGKETLLVKTYLRWLANPKNPIIDLVQFTVTWYNWNMQMRKTK